MSNIPCSLTRNMTSHSMENLTFHSLLRRKTIILQILATSLIELLSAPWDTVLLFEKVLEKVSQNRPCYTMPCWAKPRNRVAVSRKTFHRICEWQRLVLKAVSRTASAHMTKLMSREAAGEIWNWFLMGVKGLTRSRVINFNFPCSLTRNITHAAWRARLSIAYSDEMIIPPILTTSLINSPLKG